MARRPARSLTDRIITGAGYPNWTEEGPPFGGPFAEQFSEIIVALRYVGNRKVDEYGNSRLEVDPTIPDYDLKMLYSDLYRKHIRINEQMAEIKRRIWSNEIGSVDTLIDTLGDLAVYSIRGIQILTLLEEAWHNGRNRTSEESTDHGSEQRTGSSTKPGPREPAL
jgi:hypothetical protein